MTEPIVRNRDFNARQVRRIFLRRTGIALWVSFVLAGIQTAVFFSQFDPVELSLIAETGWHMTRKLGYTLGFAFFWLFTFICGFMCGVVMALPRTRLAKRRTE